MENEPKNEELSEEAQKQIEELKKTMQEILPMEFVIKLIEHIQNPCEVEVEPGVKKHIRHIYIKVAKEFIEETNAKEANGEDVNTHARDLLQEEINKYEN